MQKISKRDIQQLNEKISEIQDSLDIPSKKEILKQLELESGKEDFWKDQSNAQNVLSQIADIKGEIEKIEGLKNSLESLNSLIDTVSEEEEKIIYDEYENLEKEIKQFESLKFLSGKYDHCNAIMSIHSGQGGTECIQCI